MSDEYYVFVVYDPRQTRRTPIWIGEGTGEACRTFLKHSHPNNPELRRTLIEYRAAGLVPEVKIVKRFADRGGSTTFKRQLILQYGRRDVGTGSLLNLSGGGNRTGVKNQWQTNPKMIAKRRNKQRRIADRLADSLAKKVRTLKQQLREAEVKLRSEA